MLIFEEGVRLGCVGGGGGGGGVWGGVGLGVYSYQSFYL